MGRNTRNDAPLVPPELLSRVVNYFHPRRVVLFGSRARGEARPDSDIDLLVILDDDTPADVIPVRNAVYRRRTRIAGTLAYEAEIDGVAAYERAWVAFSTRKPVRGPASAGDRRGGP